MSTLYRYETQGRPVTFLDDADAYDNETIRKHWQTSFPELGNCQAETKKADGDQKLKETMAEGEEVEVDRVVTFVKKVGTKGGDDFPPLTEDEARAIIQRATAPDSTEEDRERFYEASGMVRTEAFMAMSQALTADDLLSGAVLNWTKINPGVVNELTDTHEFDCPFPAIRQAVAEATGEGQGRTMSDER